MGLRSRVVAQLIGIGQDVLSTALDTITGTIQAQLGDATAGVPDIDEAQWVQTPGLWSLPAAPTPDAPVNGGIAAQAITLKSGDRDVVIGVRDVRTNARYGNLKPGDTCIGASTGMASGYFKADDGSVTLATSDTNDRTGNSMFARLDPKTWRVWMPFGSQLHDNTGFHVRTGHGAKLDMGGAGLPAPFSSLGLSSAISASADVITLDAAVLSLGRDTGFTQAVVQALPLSIIAADLASAVNALNTAVAGLTAVVSGATGSVAFPGLAAYVAPGGPLALAATAVGTAATALATVNLPASTGGCATNTTIA